MTERQAPSPELVEIVKVLYQERVADVRFIIPVLSGLQKVYMKFLYKGNMVIFIV